MTRFSLAALALLLCAGLLITTPYAGASPSAAPRHFLMEATPLLLDVELGQITTILPYNAKDFLVANQAGFVYLLQPPLLPDDPWQSELLYDFSDEITLFGELGFYSIAPSPNFALNHTLYLSYINLNQELTIQRFNVETQSSETVITIPVPLLIETEYHRAGDIAFYNGLLYIAVGDHAFQREPQPYYPSQNLTNWWGKILRIDVESGDPLTYTIPADNPFVNNPEARPEIFAYGLRNPWKLAFDDLTGDLYISDVGLDAWEEVNYLPNGSSATNFGWRCYEGSFPYVFPGFEDPLCTDMVHTPPIVQYPHGRFDGRVHCAITGGRLYRGSAFPNLEGMYIYTDLCASRIWGVRLEEGEWVSYHLLDLTANFVPTAFTVGRDGMIYVAGLEGIVQLRDTAAPGSTPIPTPTPAHRLYLPLSTASPSDPK